MNHFSPWQALAALLLGTGCATRPAPPSGPPPATRPIPPPFVRITPPSPENWQDLPLTQGEWTHGAGAGRSEARFGVGAEALFAIRCDANSGRVHLVRTGVPIDALLTISTSSGVYTPRVREERDPVSALRAEVAASDPLLDAIVFSRGRFMVEMPGQSTLIVPAWPEPGRVVEDCRS